MLDFRDGTLFGNDAGEDELPEVLASYFVGQPAFLPFLSVSNRLHIARSRKGMGKSALLSKLNFDLLENDPLAIVVRSTGSQLSGSSIPEFSNLLEAQSYWVSRISSRINMELGTKVGFAFSDTQMSLVEAAELSGLKERNFIGALLSRIKIKKLPIEILEPTRQPNPDLLLQRAIEDFGEKPVWLLVDDIDASYVDTPQQQLLTSAFFSACRYVAREMRGVHIRTTVRSDVWSNLRSNEDLDKCEQYIVEIHWTKNELKSILAKKITAWILRKNLLLTSIIRTDDEAIELAFHKKLRWGNHMVAPFQAINILAAGRPRWVSQLCRLAGVAAVKAAKSKITISEINSSMDQFTRFRINDLYKEHGHQFAKLEKLIHSFIGPKVRFTTDELVSHINRMFVGPVGAARVGLVDGEEYSSPKQLARLLFKVGFLVGREQSGNDNSNAKYISYAQFPELLEHFSELERDIVWEIYPSYRQRAKARDFAFVESRSSGPLDQKTRRRGRSSSR